MKCYQKNDRYNNLEFSPPEAVINENFILRVAFQENNILCRLALANGWSICNGLNGLQPQQSKHKTGTKVPLGFCMAITPSAKADGKG